MLSWLRLYLPASFLRHVEQLLALLMTEILLPDSQAPNGVKSHFIEIFLEELAKVGADEVRGGVAQLLPGVWEPGPDQAPASP